MLESQVPADFWFEIYALVFDRWIDKVPSFSFLSKQYNAITVCRCKQLLQKVFKRIYTVYTYSNHTINQLLYRWGIV